MRFVVSEAMGESVGVPAGRVDAGLGGPVNH